MNQGSHHITASKPQPILRVPSCCLHAPRGPLWPLLPASGCRLAAFPLLLPSFCFPSCGLQQKPLNLLFPYTNNWFLHSFDRGSWWVGGGGAWMPPCCAVLCLVTQLWLTLCDLMNCSPPSSSVHGDSPGKNTGVGRHALLQGIFPIQGLNPPLLHCRQTLYCPSHQRSP